MVQYIASIWWFPSNHWPWRLNLNSGTHLPLTQEGVNICFKPFFQQWLKKCNFCKIDLLQICILLNSQVFEHSFCDIFEIRFYVEFYLHVVSKVDFIFGESGRKCKLTQPWLVQADMPLSRTQSLRNHGTRLKGRTPNITVNDPCYIFVVFIPPILQLVQLWQWNLPPQTWSGRKG